MSDYNLSYIEDLYGLYSDRIEDDYANFSSFNSDFNIYFSGNTQYAAPWISAELSAGSTPSQLYLPDVTDTADTVINDIVMGLGGAVAYDMARLLSTKNFATVVDDFGAAAAGSASPLLAQAQSSFDDYARFATKYAVKIALVGVGSKVALQVLDDDWEGVAKDAASFVIAHQAMNLSKAMMNGHAAALADGFIGPASGNAVAFYGSKVAQYGGGMLLAGATVYALNNAWELAKELHSGTIVSDYAWFLDKVEEYAQDYVDDLYDGNVDPADLAGPLAPLLAMIPAAVSLPQLPDWIPSVIQPFDQAKDAGTPLVLDLAGTGINLAALGGEGEVFWNFDGGDFANASGWIADGSGLLSIDLNDDGIINDHTELFGTETTDGFTILSAYDSNSDDVIDQNDADWDDLLVWIDENSDGDSQATELYTLDDLLITSIDLNATQVDYDIAGNHITHESTFTIDGQTHDIVDAWFTYDTVNSVYEQDYTLDESVVFLPTLRGFGNLPDLHTSMSLDNGTGGLLEAVQEIGEADAETILSSSFDLKGRLIDVLYQWAGVEDVDPSSRGAYIDARKLEFLEAFKGEDWVSSTGQSDPTSAQAALLETSFDKAFLKLASQFLAQTVVSFIFGQSVSYDPYAGTLEGTEFDEIWFSTDSSTMTASAGTNNLYVCAEGNGNLTVRETSDSGIDTLLTGGSSAQGARLSYDGSGNLFVYVGSETIELYRQFYGTGYAVEKAFFADGSTLDLVNDLTLTGTSSSEYVYGLSDDNTLLGLGGNDTLLGYDGNDTLSGGTGIDTLIGGNGADTYNWNVGDGNDVIKETTGTDTDILQFAPGITTQDVRLSYSNGNDLFVHIGSETIELYRQFSGPGYVVEEAHFEGGGTLDLVNDLTLTGTSSGEYVYGLSDNNTLLGLEGNDALYGYDGSDTLIGGTGVDTLYGGDGADTYFWDVGDGNDVLKETSNPDNDILQFGSTIAIEDVRLSYASGNLFVHVGSESIELYRQFSGPGYVVEEAHFEGGGTLDLVNDLTLTGTSSGEYVYGLSDDNTLLGLGGNDTLYGYDGDDILSGGDGFDQLYGHNGADTFVFEAASAYNDVDNIRDFNQSEDVIDISDLLSAYDPMSDAITDFVQITDNGTDSTLAVDADGGADNFVAVASILNATGLTDEAALVSNGTLLAA